MQRLARNVRLAGLAALVVVLAAGCSAGSSDGGGPTTDAKAGGPAVSAAPKGKYRTLREPCGSVNQSTLRDLLPGIAMLPKEQQAKEYEGTPAVTYDTDRRVGCSWRNETADLSHQLVIDVERVVSYDPTVSDDDEAQHVFLSKQDAAHVPTSKIKVPPPDGDDIPKQPSDTSTTSGTKVDPADNPAITMPTSTDSAPSGTQTDEVTPPDSSSTAPVSDGTAPDATASDGTVPDSTVPDGTASDGTASDALEPRELDGLGNAAFLNDVQGGSGSAARPRTVSVVFRTSNVIVTVEYTEQPTHPAVVPDSKELQEKVEGLAKQLAGQFNT